MRLDADRSEGAPQPATVPPPADGAPDPAEKPPQAATVTVGAIFASFLRVALTSFGGGMSGWVHREIVERRAWLSDREFLASLAIAQVLPGANPVNVAVYIGLQLRGGPGAVAAGVGMVLPAFCLILVLAAAYGSIGGSAAAQSVLGGFTAVGIAASLVTGIKTARGLDGRPAFVAIAAGVFVAVGVLQLPLIPVALVAAAAGIAVAYRRREGE